MKKTIALGLSLALLLSLCACGEKDVSGTVMPQETPANVEGSVETPAPAEEAEPSEAPADEAEEEFQIGTTSGGRYENAFLGIGCQLDENWTFASKEELAQLIGIVADGFDNEEYAEQLKNADMFYDMYALADEGLVTINVIFENMGVLYGTVIDEERYVQIAMENLEEQLTSAGFADIQTETGSVVFAGQERYGLRISGTYQGAPYYCQQVYIKEGSYMAAVSLVSLTQDITATMLEYFYAVD